MNGDLEQCSDSSEQTSEQGFAASTPVVQYSPVDTLTTDEVGQVVRNFRELGLSATMVSTDYSQFTGLDSEENKRRFLDNGLNHILKFDLDLTGHMDFLTDLQDLAAVSHSVIEKRSLFMYKIFKKLGVLELDDKLYPKNYRILMKRNTRQEDQQSGLMDVQSSNQQSNDSQFLVAINKVAIQKISTYLEKYHIPVMNSYLESVMSKLGFSVSASYFIENILREFDSSTFKSEFCLEITESDQHKALIDIQKLFNAIGIEANDYEVILHRFGNKNMSILLREEAIRKLTSLSPGALTSLGDIINHYVCAKKSSSFVEADATYDLFCHLLNKQEQQVADDHGKRFLIFHDDVGDETGQSSLGRNGWNVSRFIYTEPLKKERYHHLRSWKDSLIGMAYRGQLIQQPQPRGVKWLWSTFKKAFFRKEYATFEDLVSSASDSCVSDYNYQFMLKMLDSKGAVGSRILHNRKVLLDFLDGACQPAFHDVEFKKKYLQNWIDVLEKMRRFEITLYEDLYKDWAAMSVRDGYWEKYNIRMHEYITAQKIYADVISATECQIKILPTQSEANTNSYADACESLGKLIAKVSEREKTDDGVQHLAFISKHEKKVPSIVGVGHQGLLREAFADMGIGQVSITEARDPNHNIQYHVTLGESIAANPQTLNLLKGMGMGDVPSTGIFKRTAKSIEFLQLPSRKKALACDPAHVQGFINRHARYKESASIINLVASSLRFKIKMLSPYQMENKEGMHIELGSAEEASAFTVLMKMFRAEVTCEGNRVSFPPESVELLKKNGRIILFFNEFSDKIAASRKAQDQEGVSLLTGLLSHVVSQIFASSSSHYKEQSTPAGCFKFFDDSMVFSMESAMRKWLATNKEKVQAHDAIARKQGFFSKLFYKPKVVIEDFIDQQAKVAGSTIAYTMLCQEHALPEIEKQQENSMNKLLDSCSSKKLNQKECLEILEEIINSQKKFTGGLDRQISNLLAFGNNILAANRLIRLRDRGYALLTIAEMLDPKNSAVEDQGDQIEKEYPELSSLCHSIKHLKESGFFVEVTAGVNSPKGVSSDPVAASALRKAPPVPLDFTLSLWSSSKDEESKNPVSSFNGIAMC